MNVILYVMDQLRPDFLSCYGFDHETSPVLDRMCRDGVLFRNAYAVSSWTKPSGASLLTGQYPRAIRMTDQLDILPHDVVTMADVLAAHDFRCAGFSANGYISKDFNMDKGFHTFHCLLFDHGLTRKGRKIMKNLNNIGSMKEESEYPIPESQDLNAACFALDWSRSGSNFILMWSIDTHNPYCVRGKESHFGNSMDDYYLDPRDALRADENGVSKLKSLYCDMIHHNDRSIGELLDWLQRSGSYDSSMIIITSDHGEGFLDHEVVGHAAAVYEEQVRVPLIVKFPHYRYRGEVVETPVQITDIFPSILRAARIEYGGIADGTPLQDEIEQPAESRLIFCENSYHDRKYSLMVRDGTMKWLVLDKSVDLGLPASLSQPRAFARQIKEWINCRRQSGEYLFDLAVDPAEQCSLSSREFANMRDDFHRKSTDILKFLDQRGALIEGHGVTEDEEVMRQLRGLGYFDTDGAC